MPVTNLTAAFSNHLIKLEKKIFFWKKQSFSAQNMQWKSRAGCSGGSGAEAEAKIRWRWWNITYPVWRSVGRAGRVREKCVCPLGVSAQLTSSHTQRKSNNKKERKKKRKKVAFKSLSCKTTVNGYLHTQLRLTRGLSLFSFWSSRIWQHWKASAVTCAAANRAATRGIVGNGVFHQTAADIFWHDAMLFDCEGRFFRGSNFSQVALQPVLRWLTADNAQLRIHAVTTI